MWLATPDALVERMLRLAEVTASDYVIDLGAGDGKIPIAAARDFGATALGIEYDADLVRLAQCLVEVAGVGRRTRIVQGDIFVADFSDATVLTLFLLPQLNRCIRHRILAMQPGTRVVSHQFRMGEWRHDATVHHEQRTAYLWIVPARVGGSWTFRDAAGEPVFDADIVQTFQEISGHVHQARGQSEPAPLQAASLVGARISFAFRDRAGEPVRFEGRAEDGDLRGTLTAPDGTARPVTAQPRRTPDPAVWASMFPGCERYYRD
ncbi:MAG: class I SAM-dependent methyltransferase [Pseudomonadales bacterium]|nr:class I SAM-dependent methyltransferase [Pseudomonadales bacterium]